CERLSGRLRHTAVDHALRKSPHREGTNDNLLGPRSLRQADRRTSMLHRSREPTAEAGQLAEEEVQLRKQPLVAIGLLERRLELADKHGKRGGRPGGERG